MMNTYATIFDADVLLRFKSEVAELEKGWVKPKSCEFKNLLESEW